MSAAGPFNCLNVSAFPREIGWVHAEARRRGEGMRL